jgi:aspartate kinase
MVYERRKISEHLVELEQLLNGIAMMKELTKRTQDYLVSFGECMSTRIFAAYLNKLGVKARQVRVLLIAYLNLIHAVTKRLFCFFLLII